MEFWWWRIVFTFLGVISAFCSTCCYSENAPNYSFMRQATYAPLVSHYDYIVVGGGTAGCALAATLSEGANVLLLERGGAPYGDESVENLSGFGSNLGDDSAVAQPFLSEDGVYNARARVLGGGSAINAGFYTRASPEYVARAGWDGALLNESYAWVERKVAFRPPMREFQSAFRDGLVEVGVRPYNGFTYDDLEGTKFAGTIFDANGKRHSAANLLEYAIPSRTTVYLFATVHKILFLSTGKYSQIPRAQGVEFMDSKGIKHTAYLKLGENDEIIISAGALGSPQLLMLSGIGPATHLRQHGIKVVVDQPMVGQGMADPPMTGVIIPSPNPVDISLSEVVGITHSGNYIEAASGLAFARAILHPLSTDQINNRLSSDENNEPKTQYPHNKAYEFINTVGFEKNTSFAGGILEIAMGPISQGHLHLNTKNPNDNPSVTFNYFKEEEDLTRCVKGTEIITKIIESKSFSKFRFPEVPSEDLLTIMLNLPLNRRPRTFGDFVFSDLAQFCKDTVMTLWHYHGGCQVGRVVDKNYRVLNVSGLRVVDGSTFSGSPGTNPQATVMMLGRYMGRMILKDKFGASLGPN